MSTPDDVVAFVRARLDEVEADARVMAAFFPSPWDVVDRGHSAMVRADEPDYRAVTHIEDPVGIYRHPDGRPLWLGEVVAHLARHDPDRVLRDVANKRAIVDDLVRAETPVPKDIDFREDDDYVADRARAGAYRGAVCRLARTWSDHPDYPPSLPR